jgi:hypothetical protein
MLVFFLPFDAVHAPTLLRFRDGMFYNKNGLSAANAICFEYTLRVPNQFFSRRTDNFQFVSAWNLMTTNDQDIMFNARYGRNLVGAPHIQAYSQLTVDLHN